MADSANESSLELLPGGQVNVGINPAEVDETDQAILDLVKEGYTKATACKILGISKYNLKKRIQKLQNESAVILEYRALQNIELTKIQQKILENITDDKIEEASLKDLALAFKILKDAELNSGDDENKQVKGLVGYLIELEKQQLAARSNSLGLPPKSSENENEMIIEGEFSEVEKYEKEKIIEDNELLGEFGIKKFIDEPDIPITEVKTEVKTETEI